ncbi:B12-binding domain-containing protein [Streptomyces sp. NPDC059466]|uniref:B12-binding domain-containing protein n=1 Tax=unclassified Streptomyces TaxID=2593676 RepID=UPI0036B1CE9A
MTSPSVRCEDHDATVLEHARDRLWSAVSTGDESGAAAAVFATLGPAADAETVLLDVIAPVQVRVGAEWAANRLTVTQEHTATAIHERVIGALTRHPGHRNDTPDGPRVTVACKDFPRARRTLGRAREALAARAPSAQVPGPGKPA